MSTADRLLFSVSRLLSMSLSCNNTKRVKLFDLRTNGKDYGVINGQTKTHGRFKRLLPLRETKKWFFVCKSEFNRVTEGLICLME